jgi:hypothetical protein
MRRDEYEQRKQKLDEQLDAGIDLLRAAHRQQTRALDLVWMTSAEEDVQIPLPRESPAAPAAAAPAPVQEKAPAARRKAWELYDEIREALAHVPEVFDRGDMCERLGYAPDRGSLYRVFQELVQEEILTIYSRGEGRQPTRYKKTSTDGSVADT